MTNFTALPVYDGVGPYHFNRYRVVFVKPSGISKESLAREFISRFSHFFYQQPRATVAFHTDRTFNTNPTLEFHGLVKAFGIDIARPHNDWVAQVWANPDVGFTAQTLKREFFVAGEDLPAAGGGGISGGAVGAGAGAVFAGIGAAPGAVVGGVSGAGTVVHWNRMHFLAGRRSWRLDYGSAFGVAGDVCVLETVAVERLSSQFFVVGDFAFHLKNLIPAIWIANLANFVRMKDLTTVPQEIGQLGPRWEVGDPSLNINYVRWDCDTLEKLKSLPEFSKAYRLFPTILP